MDRSPGGWILDGYQSDFARNLTREGRDFAALTAARVGACGNVAALSAMADLLSGAYDQDFVVTGTEDV